MVQTRQVAFRLWLQHVLSGTYVEQSGEWDPNYVLVGDKFVARVNVVATVVDTFIAGDKSYATVTVDDGSACMRVKAFKDDVYLIENLTLGDSVLIVGRVRKYNDELYLAPEIVVKQDSCNWELLRKAELLRDVGKYTVAPPVKDLFAEVQGPPRTEEFSIDPSAVVRQKIIRHVEKMDEASLQGVIDASGLPEVEANAVIKELLKDGELYQSKPGFVRLV
ncbi:MAG: OB-fold nucleic acid binding domain-containing protein [Nanoarchaeota archaeon]|nr:OB-fold nucleic acid binding domain-containing protein [Nanoarchaeota archaeon]